MAIVMSEVAVKEQATSSRRHACSVFLPPNKPHPWVVRRALGGQKMS